MLRLSPIIVCYVLSIFIVITALNQAVVDADGHSQTVGFFGKEMEEGRRKKKELSRG